MLSAVTGQPTEWVVQRGSIDRRTRCDSQGDPGVGYWFFLFKQKTAYDISECDWSSDVCSSDLKQKTAYEISELQSHSEISYAVFCLKKKKQTSELKSNTENSYAIFRMKTEEKK